MLAPKFYHDYTERINYDGGRLPKFEVPSPFGFKAGFHTNLGIVSFPDAPIGGYTSTWQLYAEAVYL